jgi:magnesium-transporting ATPase (P-type)
MKLDRYCTGVLGMRQQSCWGFLWLFKRRGDNPLKIQRIWQHDIWCIITNTRANRVAIVSSVITKILNPCKYWTVTTQAFVICSVNQCLFYSLPVFFIVNLLFYFHSFCFSFVSICFCSTIQYSIVRLFSVFSVLILELYYRYFNPLYKTAIRQSINIIHQTAPSLS